MAGDDLVRVVVTIRAYTTPTFSTDAIHRYWAEQIFYAFPCGPFRVSRVRYESALAATVEVAGGWDFTSEPMDRATAFIVAADLDSLGFDVATGKIIPVEENS